MFIRTERLFLRPSWPEDLDELLEILNEEEIAQNLGVMGVPRTREELQARLIKPRDPALPALFIYLRDDAKGASLVGGIGLGRSEDGVELGYWIAPTHRGNAYAEEAVEALLQQAKAFGHDRIVACHFDDNVATATVLERAGFHRTGEKRERYSAGRGTVAPATLFVAEPKKIPFKAVGQQQQQSAEFAAPLTE